MPTPDLSRYDDWLTWLRSTASDDPAIRCLWVGGSAATGGYDQWSDLDVVALTGPGGSTGAYGRMVAGLRERFDVRHLWELPDSMWPDGRQCFVNLQDDPGALAEPTVLVDVCVLDIEDAHRFVDVRRHGEVLVLHDPDGLVVQRDDPEDELRAAAEQAEEQIRARRPTAAWLVNRAIARGQLPEAVDLYLRLALGGVVRLLRVEHCPWRHDYGLRYLHEDLPSDLAARVSALLPGVERLAELSAECFAWQDELLAGGTGPDGP